MKEIESLSEEQLSTFLAHFEARCSVKVGGLRDYLMISFMLHCGLRVGECVQLTWEMISLEGAVLEMVSLPGVITKSGVDRIVPMPKIVRDAVKQYALLDSKAIVSAAGFVFNSGFGPSGHISVRNVQLLIARSSKESIGVQISPHTLRHTFATRMRKLTDLPTLQRLMGHTSLKSTQVYTHPSNQDMKDASLKLDQINSHL